MREGRGVAVFDTSALIRAKTLITARRQWGFFEILKEMVQRGEVCFPPEVKNELQVGKHVDTPEAWALDVWRAVRCPPPHVNALAHVMQIAGDVVDEGSEREEADPYVLAQALEMRGLGACVITEDRVDRLPLKIAMTTACDRLDIESESLEGFLKAIAFDPKDG